MNVSKFFLYIFVLAFLILLPIWLALVNMTQIVSYSIISLGILINLAIVLFKTVYTTDLSKQELERQKSEKK